MSAAKNSWPRVRLGDVCEVVLGGTPKTTINGYWNGVIPWITPGEMGKISGPYVSDTKRKLTAEGLAAGSRLFPEKSVILSTRAPIGYVFINTVPMCTNQGCKTLVPFDRLLAEYLYWNLRGRTDELNQLGTGTTFKELSTIALKSIEIPLPPLAVQREIVSRLERDLVAVDELAKKFAELETAAEAEFKATLKETFDEISRRGAETRRLGEVCKAISTRGHQIKQSEINCVGRHPVISQSANEIEGFTDVDIAITDVPLVLFGDHTCEVKLIEQPFVVGADGVKLLQMPGADIEYLYHWLQYASSQLLDGEYRRHYSDLCEMTFPFLFRPTQREIVSRLDAAKARKDKLIAAAKRGAGGAAVWRKAILKEAFE